MESRSRDRAAFIADMFREFSDRKFSLKQLAAASGGADREGRNSTRDVLVQMLADGFIEECSRDRYRLSSRHQPRFGGVVCGNSSGSLFVRLDGDDTQDVYISRRNAHNALDGDRVQIVMSRRMRSGASPEGIVVEIVERSRKPYVGVASLTNTSIFVTPDSKRLGTDIYLPKKLYADVRDGDKVAVRIVSWEEGTRLPVGEIVDILGPAGDNDTEMHAILAEYDLPYRFNDDVLGAAAAISSTITEADYAERRDFRQVTTFTVDPADAKDFDDALSVRRLSDGVWEVGVHIADVTHYVTP
ncbi:MAG: RNB domain-containing ribonuclease, partial [Alistipes sp.]|nr:RNB domain-containing ribonuclease [Alistipes sp.]